MTRFVIRFENGAVLKQFLQSNNSLTTADLSIAKLFNNEMRAHTLADLLSGRVDEVEVPLNLNDLDPALSSGDLMSDFERILTILCEQANAIFQGVQRSEHPKHSTLILFCDASAPHDQRNTLAVNVWECSTETIARRLAEARQKFTPKSFEATA